MSSIISFSTVGLAVYKDNAIDIEEYIASLIGKTVILQLEPENDDQYAVAVTSDGKKIGYVRKKDNDDKNIYGMMMGCYRNCRSACVVRRSEHYPTLITEADFSDVTPKKEKRKKVVTEWIVDKVTPSQDSSWFCKKLSDKTASSNAALIKSFFNSPVLFASMVNKILLNSFKLAILSFASFSSYVSFKYSSYPISFMKQIYIS